MTTAAARRRGFAVPVKGHFGWFAQCVECPWEQPQAMGRYHSDATKAAQAHNAEKHKPDTHEAYGVACSVASLLLAGRRSQAVA